jgi:hypothetical protein
MIFNWSDYFYKRGPNYQQAYTDGFNDCKSECLKQIKSLEKHIERLEAYRKYKRQLRFTTGLVMTDKQRTN